METAELIKKLTGAYALSGCEDDLYDVLKSLLTPYGSVRKDEMNNVFCTFGDGYHFLLDAHTDEIGLDRRFLPASEVLVLGKEQLRGVICALPPHLRSESDKKVSKISDLAVDTGLSEKALKCLVSPGDRIVFKHSFDTLCGSRIASNCLDDRCGVAALLLALDRLKKLPVKVTVMLSAQEEVGTRGAKAGAYGIDADDVSFGYSPQCSKEDCGEVSGGAMVGFSPVLDREISKRLADCAKKHNIPYQTEVMSGRTGTNADVITLNRNGIRCGLISIPLRYMHTPSEVIDIRDVESVADLIAAYIEERAGERNA